MNVHDSARRALLAVLDSPYPREIDGVEWRLSVVWPRGSATVARGEPVSTDYRVVHRARLAVVGPVLAVRTYCGAILLDPRPPADVRLLTRPNSVLDCVRCLRRATPRRRSRYGDTILDPATGEILDVPLPGLVP